MDRDYEQWKKRRDAQHARREREEDNEGRYSPSNSPSQGQRASGNSPDNSPVSSYGGFYPTISIDPSSQETPSRRRSCLGCLGFLVGGLLLFAIGLSLLSFFYWRQIEQNGSVNVLVLGIDERSTEQPPFRSDTMLLTSFNPNRREVALLNIPRDLWLDIPNYGTNRINTAHFFDGPSLAKQAVAENFGIPLEYYVKLNFYGFVHIIDAMGGLTINVSERLYDENYPTADYGVTTIEIPAGEQQMDGETALIYARSRYSTSDFDRSRRQQEIIAAVRNKLAQPGTWFKLPAIYSAITDSISTDIPSNQWPAFGWILIRSSIERWTLGAQEVYPFVTSGGAQVLAPNWDRINPILACYFEEELSQEMCDVAKELKGD